MKKLSLFVMASPMGVAANAEAQTIYATNGQPFCREYTQTVKIGNTLQKGYGTACMQADGSWQVMTPAAPETNYSYAPPQNTTTYIVEDRPVVYYSRPYPAPVVDIVFGRDYSSHHRPHHPHYYGSRW